MLPPRLLQTLFLGSPFTQNHGKLAYLFENNLYYILRHRTGAFSFYRAAAHKSQNLLASAEGINHNS